MNDALADVFAGMCRYPDDSPHKCSTLIAAHDVARIIRAQSHGSEDDVFGDLALAVARAVEGQVASADNGFGADLVRVERCYSHGIARAALAAVRDAERKGVQS